MKISYDVIIITSPKNVTKLTSQNFSILGHPLNQYFWKANAIAMHINNKFNCIKGALNRNFLNFTKIEKNFGSRNVLVSFLNLLLLKSYERTSPFTSIPKSS